MTYQRLKIVLAVLFVSILCGCASKTLEDNDPYLGMREDVLYKKGMAALDRGYYKESISVFESYESQFPLSPKAEQVLMKYVYAQYMTGEHALAVASADRFLRLYPRSNYADYVLYLKGIANTDHSRNELDRYFPVDIALRDSTYLKMAYQDFKRLIRLYPQSKYASDARQRMILIRNTLAKKNFLLWITTSSGKIM